MADIFDEIILFLRERTASGELDLSLSGEVLNELNSAVPVKQQSVPVMPQTPTPVPQFRAPEVVQPVQEVRTPAPDCSAFGWEQLEQTAAGCTACGLCAKRTHVVFGEGDIHARLMFIGEGPGQDEDIQGRPFVGKAGQLLTKMIGAMGLRREQVYIGNIVKCRPPNNRTPLPEENEACLGYIRRQIELVQPEIIVLLGATPLLALFGLKGITKLRGKWLDYNGIRVMPTFHPSYLLRNESQKIHTWQDLQQVMKVLNLPLPGRR